MIRLASLGLTGDARAVLRSRAACLAASMVSILAAWAPAARAQPPSGIDPVRSEVQGRIDHNDFAAAESLAAQALQGGRGRAPAPADSAALIDLLVYARWRNDRQRTAGTTALAQRGLQIRLAAPHPDSLDLASSYESLAYQSVADGRVGDGIDVAGRAIAIRRARLPPDDERIARLVHHLGVLDWTAADYRGAGERFAEALAMRERSSGPRSSLTGRSVLALASAHSVLGRTDEAIAGFSRAVAIFEAPATASTRDLLFALSSLAICYGRQDRVVEAAAAAERAVRVAEERLGPHEQTANAYVSLAYARSLEGDFARARDADRRALQIFEQGHAVRPWQVVAARRYLVSTLNNCGDYAEAAEQATRALAQCETLDPPDSAILIEVCHGLGCAYQGLGRRREAIRLLRRTVAISEAKFGPDDSRTGEELSLLASIELDLGNTRRADSLFARARDVLRSSKGPRHSDLGPVLEGLALVRQDRGRPAEAESLLVAARDILERSLGPDRVETGRVYGLIARLAATRGRRREAMDSALHAERISRGQFHLVAQGLSEREALRAPDAGCSTLPLMLSLAADSTGLPALDRRRVWDAVIRSRGQVLEEMAHRRRVAGAPGDRTAPLADSLRIARANLAALVMRGADRAQEEGFREQVASRRRDADVLEEALALEHASLRRDRARDTLGLDEVERSLPPASALVAYVRYPDEHPLVASAAGRRVADRYLAFVRRTGSDEIRVVPVGAAVRIDSLLARWTAAVGATANAAAAEEARAREAGTALRRVLWDPVRARLGHASLVLIVPDGPLHLVNFAALPDDHGGYLVESGPTLQLLTAERDVVPDTTQATGRGLIALGDPRFDEAAPSRADTTATAAARTEAMRGADPDCGAFRELRFARLPGTHDEITRIARLWSSADSARGPDGSEPCVVLEGAQATESELARRLRGRRVLHLATHGFFLDARCVAESRDAGTRGVGGMVPWSGTVSPDRPAATRVAGNPLLLSGLALSGANRRNERRPGEDDGILTAEELSTLDLSGIEWAVLSACRTGVGEVASGEGVFGLRRALRIAGARSVITSLWPVGDVSTRAWMVALYRARLEQHRSTADAVRAASLGVLRDRRARGLGTSPLYWGAFLAAGDWR